MGINSEFPLTACNHFQVLVVETEILVRCLVLYNRGGVFNCNSRSILTETVNVYRTLLHDTDLFQTHFCKVRTVLVHGVTKHEYLDIITLSDDGG